MNPNSTAQNNVLQVQPQFFCCEEWMALSVREGLFFEPLEFFLPPAILDADEFNTLRDWYRQSGRVRSLHGAFIDVNPAGSDPYFAALSRQRCHESCRLAVEIGAEQVVFHASAHPFLRGAYIDNWAAKCADFYTELAESYGVGIRVENSPDVDCTPLRKLMQRIQASNVAVCLDIGHAHHSRVPLEQWFDELGAHIRYLHLSDNMGAFDDHLPIGSGSIQWEKIHRLWESLNTSMPMTLEVGGLDGVEKSLRYLRSHGYFGQKEA